jgi:hypothetical protein
MRRSRIIAGLFAVFMLVPASVYGQSAQLWSLQFSALGSLPFGGGLTNVSMGPGWEAQLRVNPSAWSFGFGVEQTFHDTESVDDQSVALIGGFFEPRLVIDIGSDNAMPYLSGRGAVSQLTITQGESTASSNGFTLNGGGGFLVRMGDRVNLDLGVTVGYKKLGILELGASTIDMGSGANAIARVGLAIGLGG